jgi:hypothetical protein
MEEKYPLKYEIKGNKKGGVCGIYVKNVKESQSLSIIRRKAGYTIGQHVITVLKVSRQKDLLG